MGDRPALHSPLKRAHDPLHGSLKTKKGTPFDTVSFPQTFTKKTNRTFKGLRDLTAGFEDVKDGPRPFFGSSRLFSWCGTRGCSSRLYTERAACSFAPGERSSYIGAALGTSPPWGHLSLRASSDPSSNHSPRVRSDGVRATPTAARRTRGVTGVLEVLSLALAPSQRQKGSFARKITPL